MLFNVNTRFLVKMLFVSLFLVISLNYLTIFLFYEGILNGGLGFKIFSLFTVDFKTSLPTYFNTFLILVALAFLAMITLHLKKIRSQLMYNWMLLTLAFLILSLDENPDVHNFFVRAISKYDDVGHGLALNYAWGMPYGAIAILFIFFLIKFSTTIPKDIAEGFVVSGVIYVLGAIVIGMFGTRILHIHGLHNIKHALAASYEESLEMIGLTLFIYFLLKYIRVEFKSFSFEIN